MIGPWLRDGESAMLWAETGEGKTMVATVEDGKVRLIEVLPRRNFGRDVEAISSEISSTTVVILNPNAMLREDDAVASAPLTAAK